MGRWASQYEVRKSRRAAAERLQKEREQRMDSLVAWLSEHRSQAATKIRSVPATR